MLIAGLLVLLTGGYFGYQFYHKAFSVNTPATLENNVLLIPSGSVLEDVIDSLLANGQILNENHFRWTAGKMNFHDNTIRKGRYVIKAPSSNKEIISQLRGGKQTPIGLTIKTYGRLTRCAGA